MGVQSASTTPKDYYDRKSKLRRQDQNKVSLVGGIGGYEGLYGGEFSSTTSNITAVTFSVTPELTESGNVLLPSVDGIRSAASIVWYMGSPSRTFSISATLVSRNKEEADSNYRDLYILKAWRMPAQSAKGDSGVLGNNNPEVLRLFAYKNLINGVPVVMEQIGIHYSSEVDYIQTSSNGKFPIILKVDMGFKEVRTETDMDNFNYSKYKQGILEAW